MFVLTDEFIYDFTTNTVVCTALLDDDDDDNDQVLPASGCVSHPRGVLLLFSSTGFARHFSLPT